MRFCRLSSAVVPAMLLALASSAAANETATYKYDALGRLIGTVRSDTANNNTSANYQYDAAGNRINVTVIAPSITAMFNISGPAPVDVGGTAVFTVTKSGYSPAASLNYSTVDGSAIAPTDYGAVGGVLSFGPTETQKTISVSIVNKNQATSSKQFTVAISTPTVGSIGAASAAATIKAYTPPVTAAFSVSDAPAVDPGGTAVFALHKSGYASGPITLNYYTSDVTAHSNNDFNGISGVITFAATETDKTLSVVTLNNNQTAPAKNFHLLISGPSAGTITNYLGTATIKASVGTNPLVANDDNYGGRKCVRRTVSPLDNDTDLSQNLPLTIISVDASPQAYEISTDGTNVTFMPYFRGNYAINYTVRDTANNMAVGHMYFNNVADAFEWCDPE